MSSRRTALDWLLLAASLSLLAMLAGAMLWGGAPSDTPGALPHPAHGSFLEATGPESPSLVGWGYAVGLANLFLMAVAIALGVRKAGALGRLGRWLMLGCTGVTLIFTALVWTYRHAGLEAELVGAFPPATAWMIYGIWWFPAIMVLGISLAFRRSWLTEEDVAAFRALLARRDRPREDR